MSMLKQRVPKPLMLGAFLLAIALISIPVIPMLSSIPDRVARQPMMSDLPDRADGAYLEAAQGSQSGMIKLYPWSFPLDDFPEESPALSPSQFQDVMIAQKGLDSPGQYHLFHMDDGDQIDLDTREVSFQHTLSMTPREHLDDGAYMLDVPIGGMFAGRQYYYFKIDSSVSDLPAVVELPNTIDMSSTTQQPLEASSPNGGISGFWPEIFPLASFLISLWMALIMLARMRQKIRPHELVWAIAFLMFATASFVQVFGDIAGWSPALARIYYLFGATLVVGWLGLGTWYVIIQRPWLRAVGLYTILFLSGYAIGLVSLSSVNMGSLSLQGWHALEKPLALTILTIGINVTGTIVLVGGALYSAWIFWNKRIQRSRMYGLILLAIGALTVAAGGSLTRFGKEQYLYLAMSIGIFLMFWGYRKTIEPTKGASLQGNGQIPEIRLEGRISKLKA